MHITVLDVLVWASAIVFVCAMHHFIPRLMERLVCWLNTLSPPSILLRGEQQRRIHNLQDDRERRGLPPLENPHL